ncbi:MULTISPECIES: signal peptidase II [Nitrincola]|uniref:Lipoprotein signal peptidase n=1 Tax=Nitrincola nitratireducens TaxID=1229521 RepID=W9UTJ7_9GAMM|nr:MULTISPECIES: signal peptidase II [Nitrincola]EXJ10399.1 Lipoprotein signal peptidase [Nitrincola nitratireducens]
MTDVNNSTSALRWLWITVLVIVLDLGTKYWADAALIYAQPVPILPFFDLTLLYNYGAAFSFLAGAGGWQRWFFAGIAIGMSVFLLVWLKRTPAQEWWMRLALALVLGGALGNLYDRIIHGYVVDFISLHYGGWYFPAFNLADTAITLGALLLIIDMLFLAERRKLMTSSSEEGLK